MGAFFELCVTILTETNPAKLTKLTSQSIIQCPEILQIFKVWENSKNVKNSFFRYTITLFFQKYVNKQTNFRKKLHLENKPIPSFLSPRSLLERLCRREALVAWKFRVPSSFHVLLVQQSNKEMTNLIVPDNEILNHI